MIAEYNEEVFRELLRADDTGQIKAFCTESHPASVAEAIEPLESHEIWQILHLLPGTLRAEIFPHFSLHQQVELATGENRHGMAKLLEEMEPDDRADLVQRLDEEISEEILPLVARAEREDIRKLIAFEQGTVGSVMNTDYATLQPDLTVSQALEAIRRQAPGKATIYYIYVVDNQRQLIGLVSLRDLIMSKPAQVVRDIMDEDIVTVNVHDDQEDVARKIEKFDLIAIPVVSAGNVLVGIVTHDDAIDILRQEQQEDVERLMAISGSHETDDYLETNAWGHFKRRAIWLVILAMLGMISGLIVQNFEALLLQFAVLAMFMPMLADTGGNTGSQSATLVVRALSLREISPADAARVILKEFSVAIMLAVLLATLAMARVMVFGGGSSMPEDYSLFRIGMAVSLALGLQVITATLLGALLPLAAVKFRQDPAVVASPALTTIVDITGLLIYFTTAKYMLGF